MANYSGALGEFANHQSTATNRYQQQQSQQAIAAGVPTYSPFSGGGSPYSPVGMGAPAAGGDRSYANWQAAQQDAAAHGTAPQGGYQDAAVWGNFLRQNDPAVNPSSPYGGGMASPDQKLEEQRRLAFAALDRQRQFYNSPAAQATQGAIMGQMTGAYSPYPALTQQQLAQDADSAAGSYASAMGTIDRNAANAGVKVGGAKYNVQRDINAQTRRNQGEITSRNALLEDQRRERGIGLSTGLLRDQAANSWAPTQAEVGLRSRFEVTGQSPFAENSGAAGGGAGIPSGYMGSVSNYNPYNTPGGAGGQGTAGGSYGGVSYIPGANMQPWKAGGSSERNNRGGGMGLNLSNYDSYYNEYGGPSGGPPPGTNPGTGAMNYSTYDTSNAGTHTGSAYGYQSNANADSRGSSPSTVEGWWGQEPTSFNSSMPVWNTPTAATSGGNSYPQGPWDGMMGYTGNTSGLGAAPGGSMGLTGSSSPGYWDASYPSFNYPSTTDQWGGMSNYYSPASQVTGAAPTYGTTGAAPAPIYQPIAQTQQPAGGWPTFQY